MGYWPEGLEREGEEDAADFGARAGRSCCEWPWKKRKEQVSGKGQLGVGGARAARWKWNKKGKSKKASMEDSEAERRKETCSRGETSSCTRSTAPRAEEN